MTRILIGLTLGLVACAARAGEEELEVNVHAGRRAMDPDPLVLPQWRAEDRAALADGQPVNLGGGLWSEERYPLQPASGMPSTAGLAGVETSEFLRLVDPAALAQGSWPIASAAGPEAAALLRPRPRTPWLSRRSLQRVLSALAGIAVCSSACVVWRRHRRPRVFHSLEGDLPGRLGGPHSGGSGAVLRW